MGNLIFVVISIVFCVGVGLSALTGKVYVCRDPDTGKLYPINSTWRSTSFCGNYTCKLRKKPVLENDSPIRVFNIDNTNPKLRESQDISAQLEEITKNEYSSNIPKMANTDSKDPSIELKPKININPQNDRYLSENEIKSISQLLHSMKKSDLEAIVDVYNLAQDIYAEMDKVTTQNILDEAVQTTRNSLAAANNKQYWYEPWSQNRAVGHDMAYQASNPSAAVIRTTTTPYSYFSGPLQRNDFGSLPYYYPMSNVQRQPAYLHSVIVPGHPIMQGTKPPCPQATKIHEAIHSAHNPYIQRQQNYGSLLKKHYTLDTQKPMQPSVLLPYPFLYIQQYNSSRYPLNSIKDDKKNWPYINHGYFKAYLSEVPKNTIVAEDLSAQTLESHRNVEELDAETLESNRNIETTILEDAPNVKPVSKEAWQTDPLSEHTLEDIRANINDKAKVLKPLSLNKKLKLERVGRVLKVDSLYRDKRSSEVKIYEDNYETYLESVTCQAQVDLGYYKMGNMSESYPNCCPQKIEDNH